MKILLLAASIRRGNGGDTTPVVTYDRYYAVGGENLVIIENGIAATETPVPGKSWFDVAVGNGIIVVTSYSSNVYAWRKFNSSKWTVSNMNQFGTLPIRSVTFLNGKFWFTLTGGTATTRVVGTADFDVWQAPSFGQSTDDVTFRSAVLGNEIIIPTQHADALTIFNPNTLETRAVQSALGGAYGSANAAWPIGKKVFVTGQRAKISMSNLTPDGAIIGFSLKHMVEMDGAWRGVVWCNAISKYVAIGARGTGMLANGPMMASSPDGSTWTQHPNAEIEAVVGATNSLVSVCQMDDVFLIGTANGSVYSTRDFVTYDLFRTLAGAVFNIKGFNTVGEFVDPVYPTGPNDLLAVAAGGNQIYLRYDTGVEDNYPQVGTSQVFQDISVGNGFIVAVTTAANIAYKKITDATWTLRTIANLNTHSWRSVTFNNGKFYFVGSTSANGLVKVYASANLTAFTEIPLTGNLGPLFSRIQSIGKWLSVPMTDENNVQFIDTEDFNRKVLTKVNFAGTGNVNPLNIKLVNGKIIAVGVGGKLSVADYTPESQSPFGTFVSRIAGSDSGGRTLRDVEYIESIGLYIAVGSTGNDITGDPVIMTSQDAVTWTNYANALVAVGSQKFPINAIAKLGTGLVIALGNGSIYSGPNLESLTQLVKLNVGARFMRRH